MPSLLTSVYYAHRFWEINFKFKLLHNLPCEVDFSERVSDSEDESSSFPKNTHSNK